MKKNSIYITLISIITIYAIVGFVAVPKLLKPQLEKVINENITQKATLEKIEFNPFLLKFTAHNLKIFDEVKKESTIEVEKLFVDFSVIKSIDEQHIAFKQLQVSKPYVNIIQYEDGTLNLQKLVKEQKEKPKKEENTSSSDIKFQIYKTILEDTRINFTKLKKDNEPFKLTVNKLNYTFYDMGTYRNILASHSFRMILNSESELVINGGLRLDPFKMYGNVEINNLRPEQFLAYEKDLLNFDLNKEAYLNLQFGYQVDTTKDLELSINDAYLDINDLDLTQNKNSILSMKNFVVENLNLQYPQNKVLVDSLLLNKLNVKAIVNKDGVINFTNLTKNNTKKVQTKEVTEKEPTVVEKEEEKTEVKTTEEKNEVVKKEDTKPWNVTLKKLNINNSDINYSNLVNALTVDTKNINLNMNDFNLQGTDFTLANLALDKPDINFKDNKNKLTIVNKGVELNISDLKSNSGNIILNSLALKNSNTTFKDLKNSLDIYTENIALNVKNTTIADENINIENIALNNSKLDFKDLKNKLNVFTKKTDIKLSNLKKEQEKISIANVSLKNPSIFVRDNKNSLKILTNSLSLDSSSLNINGSDLSVKKTKLNTPTVKFEDLKSNLDVTTKNINIIATNTSLIKEKLKVAILSLTKPTVYMVDNKNDLNIIASRISLKLNDISNYKDKLYISKVNLYEPNVTIKDKKAKTDIVAKNIYVNVRKITNQKSGLKIVTSSINKPYISITLGKKDKVKEEEQTAITKETTKKVVKKKKSDFKFDIGPINIKDMKMTFEDKNLPIPFKTDVSKLNGKFSRLNSSSSKPTKLELEGKVDEYGYTKITGTVDINDIKLLTDTNLLFKNIAIKNFTPYSGKFVGREIESGKLDLDLKYNIKKSDLNAKNSIIISDIKLGKNVDSPDAVNLPLELAIALLEDSDGVIDIDLPVSGNVDDPQFSIAPIVWKVFTNLIVKAITSPFALLGALLGVDEEKIKSIEFEYGKSDIIASEKETLDNISKILSKKPKLAIKINPIYDPVKDKLALQDIKFEKFLIKEMDKIPEGDEYKEALEDIYDDLDGVKDIDDVEESFIKKDKDGKEQFDNEAYVNYLRTFLASKQKVEESELVQISKKRVENIKEYLLNEKKVPADSIIIEEIKKQTTTNAKWAVFEMGVSSK